MNVGRGRAIDTGEFTARASSKREICSLNRDALGRVVKDISCMGEYEMTLHPAAVDILREAGLNSELIDMIEETMFLEGVIELYPADRFLAVVARIRRRLASFQDGLDQ